jgi:hypothetical protein
MVIINVTICHVSTMKWAFVNNDVHNRSPTSLKFSECR